MKNIANNYRRIKLLLITVLAVLFLASSIACAFAEAPTPTITTPDALQQLNRMKEQFDKYNLQEDLNRDLENQDKKSVDDEDVEKARRSKGTDLKFKIKEVQFTESTVLTKAELDKVSGGYIDREVTLDELYKLVDEVNDLYRRKGYAVCRAFLPEQTIKTGIAKITLVEGKTGKVKLDNVRFTRKDYVLSRMGLTRGKVNNLRELNRRVSLFNATNDAQVEVKLAAGEEQGTTDYILKLNEPNRHTVYLMMDNSGSDSTGVLRYGAGWTINSLLGIRDSLSFSYIKTDTSDSGGVSLSFPISKVGTRISASVYGNNMDMTGFEPGIQKLGPHGDSVSYKVDLSQPFCVTPQLRIAGDFFWYRQYSDSNFQNARSVQWKDDTVTKLGGSLAFTHFGRGIVWYHNYMVTKAHMAGGAWKNDSERYMDYWIWNFNFVRQQAFMNGHSLTIKINAQYAPNNEKGYYNSSDAFYLGGIGSVRGYKESIIGGDHGFSVNLEYAMPFRKYRNLAPILFFDYGRVYGPNSFKEANEVASTGLGLRWGNNDGSLSARVWLGFPLVKDLGSAEVDSARVHLTLYAQCGDWLQLMCEKLLADDDPKELSEPAKTEQAPTEGAPKETPAPVREEQTEEKAPEETSEPAKEVQPEEKAPEETQEPAKEEQAAPEAPTSNEEQIPDQKPE